MAQPVYPPDVRFGSTSVCAIAVPRGSKTPCKGVGRKPLSSGRGHYPSKLTLLNSIVRGWQMGRRSLRPVTSGSQKTGCANRIFCVQRPSPGFRAYGRDLPGCRDFPTPQPR